MIKVLMIANSYPNSLNENSGIFVHEQAKALKNFGCEIEVLCPIQKQILGKFKGHNNIPSQSKIDEIKINYYKYRMIPSRYGFTISTFSFTDTIIKKVRKTIITSKPDIIHTHWATPSGYAGIKLGKKYNIPVVCTLRGSDINNYPYKGLGSMRMTKAVLQGADKIITVSKALKTEAEKISHPKKNIEVIYNGVDIERFNNTREKSLTNKALDNISKDDKILLFVGRLIKEKGIWELLHSFATICKYESNIKLLIIGDGKERENTVRFCYENNIQERVIFLGNVPNEGIEHWYNFCDIFILPSYTEGLPNVVVEAMACGKPVIATNVGGIPEVINKKTGILVPPRNIDNLTKELLCLLNNQSLRSIYGENAKLLVNEQFNRKSNVRKILGIYQKLLSER